MIGFIFGYKFPSYGYIIISDILLTPINLGLIMILYISIKKILKYKIYNLFIGYFKDLYKIFMCF